MVNTDIQEADIQDRAVETIIAFNAAVQRIRLFPVSNPATADYIDKAFDALSRLLTMAGEFRIERLDNGARVCGERLREKHQRKVQVGAFLDLVFSFGVRVLALENSLSRMELAGFLELLNEKLENLEPAGGLGAALIARGLSHVRVDGDAPAPASPTAPPPPASDEAGRPALEPETIGPMLSALEMILEGDRRAVVCEQLACALTDRKDGVVLQFLAREPEGVFGAELSGALLERLEPERYERLMADVRQIRDGHADPDAGLSPEAAGRVLERMTRTDRGRKTMDHLNQKTQQRLKSGLEAVVRGDIAPLSDDRFLQGLPLALERFLDRENDKTGPIIVDRLADALLKQGPETRARVAPLASRIFDMLAARPGHSETLINLSYKLVGWVRFETEATPSLERVFHQLRDLARNLIRNNAFDQCRHILKIFNLIHAGRIHRPESLTLLAEEMLKGIAVREVAEALLDDLAAADENTRNLAMERLAMLGAGALEPALGRLRESESRTERSRLLRVVCLMGQGAVPALRRHIEGEIPWYYARNLVLLFGKVGNAEQLDVLKNYLDHADIRVRREALNSIYSIGGEKGAAILIDALPRADDSLKLIMVGMLGAWGRKEAGPALMRMLESEALAASRTRNELAEKICVALGAIGTAEAAPLLAAIAGQKKKSGLITKGYGEKARAAAAAAREAIQRKAAENHPEK